MLDLCLRERAMSTDYTIQISSSTGEVTTLKIIDSIIPIPGADSWEAEEPEYWDTKGGQVSSWNQKEAKLGGPAGVESIVLDGFGKRVKKGYEGTGRKNYVQGIMPGGEIKWLCYKVE